MRPWKRSIARAAVFCGSAMLASFSGCAPSESPKPPIVVAEKPKAEIDWSRTNVSDEAYRSLGIVSVPVRIEPVQDTLKLIGNVAIPQGAEVSVTAPMGGHVGLPADMGTIPLVGQKVDRGQMLLEIAPVLSPVEQIQLLSSRRAVENELAKAKENLAVVETEFQRVEGLVSKGLRGQQDFEQARARLRAAHEDVTAAEDRQKLFGTSQGVHDPMALSPVSVRAPRSGTVLVVHCGVGQYVAPAAPLVVIADLSRLWVRVAVPEHYLPQWDPKEPATISVRTPARPTLASPAETSSPTAWSAKPVGLVPQVDLIRHTADVLYELESGDIPTLSKDQTVIALVPLGRKETATLVPYSALIFDAFGGSWIYVEESAGAAGDHRFERRRVEMGARVGDSVVVTPMFAAGEKVVVQGAAALFSREFYKPPAAKGH